MMLQIQHPGHLVLIKRTVLLDDLLAEARVNAPRVKVQQDLGSGNSACSDFGHRFTYGFAAGCETLKDH